MTMKRTLTNATVALETDAVQDCVGLRVRLTVTTATGEMFTAAAVLPTTEAVALFRVD